MDTYTLREGLVPRDIGGKYFMIDTHKKYRSREGQLDMINESAYLLTSFLAEKSCTLSELASKFCDAFDERLSLEQRAFYTARTKQFIDQLTTRGAVLVNGKSATVQIATKPNLESDRILQPKTTTASVPDLIDHYWGPRRHIFQAGIELTPNCNLRCVHCYNQNEDRRRILPTAKILRMIDILWEHGILSLYFTGGEILTRPDFKTIYLYAKHKGFLIELLTNGTLITDELVSLWEEYPPGNISISVYGATPTTFDAVTQSHGYWGRLMENLKKLKAHDLPFEIKFIGLKANKDDYHKVKALAEALNVPFRYSYELFPAVHGGKENLSHQVPVEFIVAIEKSDTVNRERFKAISQNRRQKPANRLYLCAVARYMIFIDYEGFINPCTTMRQKRFNIFRGELSEAWRRDERYIHVLPGTDYPCLNCEYYSFCSPCVEKNKLFTGNREKPDPAHCKLIAERVKAFSSLPD